MLDPSKSKVYLVGGGIASLAAAVFLIRDAGVPGASIRVFEQASAAGGATEGGAAPTGGRASSVEHDVCTSNMLSTIPSLKDPTNPVSARDITHRAETEVRIVRRHRRAPDGPGQAARDRADLDRLLGLSEHVLGADPIGDYFRQEFFDTDLWSLWRARFAFQPWHSAIELRRHLVCFGREFERAHVRAGGYRGTDSRYDSVVVPVRRWLQDNGVRLDFNVTVEDIDFRADADGRRATMLYLTLGDGTPRRIPVGPQDCVFVTNGSVAADATYGDTHTVPDLIRTRRDGSWRLWESLAGKASDFGRPSAFFGDIDRTGWESFTVALSDSTLPDRIAADTGTWPTFRDSAWQLSLVVPEQPHTGVQRPGTQILWGNGLRADARGDFVPKPMAACTGAEILDELLGHLGFQDIAAHVCRTTVVTTMQMPYAGAPLQPRTITDRPLVVPERARNFAFLGQFVEIPEAVAFTAEYSVRSAMMAVYHHFAVDAPIPSPYRSPAEATVAWFAPKATRVPG